LILYLDTSALVKLYVEEPGSSEVRHAIAQAERVVTHGIAYVEARAAFRRRAADATDADALQRWRRDFEADWPKFDVVGAAQTLLHRAGELADLLSLRGYDAVHLAAAEALHQRLGTSHLLVFGAYDKRLALAAQSLGIDVFPSEP
jgi:predicted nucleic acid-binding protein